MTQIKGNLNSKTFSEMTQIKGNLNSKTFSEMTLPMMAV